MVTGWTLRRVLRQHLVERGTQLRPHLLEALFNVKLFLPLLDAEFGCEVALDDCVLVDPRSDVCLRPVEQQGILEMLRNKQLEYPVRRPEALTGRKQSLASGK